jgi:hypothetical protein
VFSVPATEDEIEARDLLTDKKVVATPEKQCALAREPYLNRTHAYGSASVALGVAPERQDVSSDSE